MSETDEEFTDVQLGNAKYQILDIFNKCNSTDVQDIIKWISSGTYLEDLEMHRMLIEQRETLMPITKSLRQMLPFDAIMPTENIRMPTEGVNSDCNTTPTIHIDDFLYDDEDLDALVEKGKLSRFYCTECKSRDIKEIVFISHSLSKLRISYLFNVLLPNNLKNQTVIDVGSRVGAVLYGAYFMTNVSSIVGIEINNELCQVQRNILRKNKLDKDRVNIVNADVLDKSDLIEKADFVILNNVFEFFMDVVKQKEIWKFLKSNLRKGTHIVSIPSVVESLTELGIYDEFQNWLENVIPYQRDNEIHFDMDDGEYGDIFFYKVR